MPTAINDVIHGVERDRILRRLKLVLERQRTIHEVVDGRSFLLRIRIESDQICGHAYIFGPHIEGSLCVLCERACLVRMEIGRGRTGGQRGGKQERVRIFIARKTGVHILIGCAWVEIVVNSVVALVVKARVGEE